MPVGFRLWERMESIALILRSKASAALLQPFVDINVGGLFSANLALWLKGPMTNWLVLSRMERGIKTVSNCLVANIIPSGFLESTLSTMPSGYGECSRTPYSQSRGLSCLINRPL